MGHANGLFALESSEVEQYDYFWSIRENLMDFEVSPPCCWNYRVCLYDSETGTLAMYVLDY